MSNLPVLVSGNPEFSESDKNDLQMAKNLLETPGIISRITDLIGKPIEKGFELLPDNWNQEILEVTQSALTKASEAAIFTMKDLPGEEASNRWHKCFVALTGAAGGYGGLSALAIELPISTTIMLRSIAEIAREQGERIGSPETKMACLEVFALGGQVEVADSNKSAYFAMRLALARQISEAIEYLSKGMIQKVFIPTGAPPLARAITTIAERFSIQITEKAAAQAAPVIGAFGGAVINTMFIDHYQDIAKGHFTVRKLERKYGKDEVKNLYEYLPGNRIQ